MGIQRGDKTYAWEDEERRVWGRTGSARYGNLGSQLVCVKLLQLLWQVLRMYDVGGKLLDDIKSM